MLEQVDNLHLECKAIVRKSSNLFTHTIKPLTRITTKLPPALNLGVFKICGSVICGLAENGLSNTKKRSK